jgi:L-alanine-DL-glutamate epimerase-like enolase superfamily enzyme
VSQGSAFGTAGIAYVKLMTDIGAVGIGFEWTGAERPASELRRQFETVAEHLVGESPFYLRNQLRLPDAGTYPGPFRKAVDIALWDLCGKHLGMPVYELMGGENPVVPAYASGLVFEYDDDTAREVYEEFAELGFDAAKVKVGYPTVEEDIDRLRLVQDVLGDDCDLMIDINRTWTPKKTIRRAHAYHDAGFDIHWIEDPVPQNNLDGAKRVVDDVPYSLINYGEYLNFDGKQRVLSGDAVDMLNLRNGLLSESLNAAAAATSHNVELHVGNIQADIGVHVAAALPETPYVEYWKRPWDRIVDRSITVSDGTLVAPDRPGHGVTIREEAIEKYGEQWGVDQNGSDFSHD